MSEVEDKRTLHTVVIRESDYKQLLKYMRYVHNWHDGQYKACKVCGELHPNGCICLNCENNKELKQ